MNKTHVRAGQLAGLHRRTLRARGAALAIEALNSALEASVGSPGPYSPLLSREFSPVATAAYFAIRQHSIRRMHFAQRRDAFYDTRLARANGWGSAGDKCPAGHDAKTPAVREQVAASRRRSRNARRVATVSARDTSACANVQRPREAIA